MAACGTWSAYCNGGCRCDPCSEAARMYKRRQYAAGASKAAKNPKLPDPCRCDLPLGHEGCCLKCGRAVIAAKQAA